MGQNTSHQPGAATTAGVLCPGDPDLFFPSLLGTNQTLKPTLVGTCPSSSRLQASVVWPLCVLIWLLHVEKRKDFCCRVFLSKGEGAEWKRKKITAAARKGLTVVGLEELSLPAKGMALVKGHLLAVQASVSSHCGL